MNFVPSSTDPPPTASRKSMSPARTISTAFISVSKRGFGSMPPNSVTGRAGQRRAHLLVDAILLDAAAAVCHQDARAGRDFGGHFGDLAFAEQNLDRVPEFEIKHMIVRLRPKLSVANRLLGTLSGEQPG